MAFAKWVVLLGTLFFLRAEAGGSAGGSKALKLVSQGDSLLAQDRWKDAKNAFEKALKKDRELVPAMDGLARTALGRQKWGEANTWYERILERQPDNLNALYHRGICFRETGKFKAAVFRTLDWRQSEKQFERVLARDSLYQDVLTQYARLQRYRGRYTDALLLGHRQVALKPDVREAHQDLFRLYTCFLDNRGTYEVMAWLRWRGTEYDRYFVGETERRAGNPDEADRVLQAWLASRPSISTVPALLSLTRLYYELEESGTAEGFFWAAVDSIWDRLDAELVFADVKYVVTNEEMQEFEDCASPEVYIDFFRRFWIRRDPTPAEDINVRLEEHYHRMLYSEEYYVFDGFRTWSNSPDKGNTLDFPPPFYLNDRFNDKGLIYIRHGEPDDAARTLGIDIPLNDSWYYGKADTLSGMVFHFAIDENAAGNNWRVAPFPPSFAGRETWGPTYQRGERGRRGRQGRRGRRGRQRSGPTLRRSSIEHELTVNSQDAVITGFRTDRHAWARDVDPLDIDSYLACFKAPEGKTALRLFYGLRLPPEKALEAVSDTSLFYEYGLALHDLEWNLIEQHRGQIVKQDVGRLTYEEMWIGQTNFVIRPDSCHAAFYLGAPDRKDLGGWKGGIRISEFSETALGVSSIVPAYTISPAEDSTAFFTNGLHLVPNPSTRFKRKKPVYVYFEIYNLAPDEEGATSYVIEYSVSLVKKKRDIKKVFSIFDSDTKPTTSVTVERLGDRPTSAEYLALDLSRVGRGKFRLDVTVTDRQSGEQSESAMDLVLF